MAVQAEVDCGTVEVLGGESPGGGALGDPIVLAGAGLLLVVLVMSSA